MIEARHLTKRHGDKLAVSDLSFTVRPGFVTGFVGPNVPGTPPTIRLIVGPDAPTPGEDRSNDGLAVRLLWTYAGCDYARSQPLEHLPASRLSGEQEQR
jgi:ABC-type branched-subunit amino acid transport system ATPase component